jgi:hypothetical protein
LGGLISAQASLLSGHLVFVAVLIWRLSRAWVRDHGGVRALMQPKLRGKFNKQEQQL